MKKILTLCFSLLVLTASAKDIDESGFQAKLGFGSSFSPQTWMISGTVEYRVDPFLAIGPSLLWGLGSITDYFVPTLGARLILPKEYFNEDQSVPGVDLFIQAGAGVAFRETTGFRKTDVTYQAGLGADVFVTPHVSLGLQGNVNFVGEDVESSFLSLLGTLGFRF